jgi:hypothetical protein
MRNRRHWILVSAVLAISACSLYTGDTEHTPHLTAPDAAISDHDGGCGGDHDGGGYLPDGGVDNDGGSYGGNDGGIYGNDGGSWLPDAWVSDGGGWGLPDAGH